MDGYTLLGLKLAMGIIGLVLQINLMGKGNLAPTSAMDQVQNYVLGALLVVTSLYLRHRLQTKYRDLSIIFLLLIIFLLGVQYKQYERNEVYAADISSVVTFLNSVKDSQNLQKEDIRTNSRTLMNGMILNIRDQYFEVHFNNDFSAYTLSPINLVNPNVTVIDKEDK